MLTDLSEVYNGNTMTWLSDILGSTAFAPLSVGSSVISPLWCTSRGPGGWELKYEKTKYTFLIDLEVNGSLQECMLYIKMHHRILLIKD